MLNSIIIITASIHSLLRSSRDKISPFTMKYLITNPDDTTVRTVQEALVLQHNQNENHVYALSTRTG
jgi:hypothetical protein